MPDQINRKEPNLTFCTEVPDPPATLKATGAERWTVICQCMLDNGNLAYLFLPTVEHICGLYDRFEYLTKRYNDLEEKNLLFQRTTKGIVKHPVMLSLNQVHDQILKGLETLGMSPKSRKNGNLPVQGNANNPLNRKSKRVARPQNIDSGIDFPTIPMKAATG